METVSLITWVISGLIVAENESWLLLALVTVKDSVPVAECTMLYGALLDLSGFLTIEKGSLSHQKANLKLSIPSFDV